jgi:raffinose/stachyose/melibiose transport system permease protein
MYRDLKRPSARVAQCLMLLHAVFNIFILIYLIYSSMRTRADFLSNTFALSTELTFNSYIRVIVNDGYFRYFFNSLLILAGAILLLVALSSTVAYALGHYRFKGKKAFQVYFLIGLMFPIQLGIVPVFLLMKNAGLIDTFLAVILICGSSISMAVFLLTNFFSYLPEEIYEAAILDGAGEFRTFLQIMFPLASPVIFSMSILTAMNIWNQIFIPMIFLQSDIRKTLPLLIMKYTNKLMMTMDAAFAASVLTVVPILILFTIFSKNILNGIAEGGVKG